MRRPGDRDRGASMMEYVALATLAVIVVVGLVSGGLPARIGDGLGATVCRVVGGAHCAAPDGGRGGTSSGGAPVPDSGDHGTSPVTVPNVLHGTGVYLGSTVAGIGDFFHGLGHNLYDLFRWAVPGPDLEHDTGPRHGWRGFWHGFWDRGLKPTIPVIVGAAKELGDQVKGLYDVGKMAACVQTPMFCPKQERQQVYDTIDYIRDHPGDAVAQVGRSVVEPCLKAYGSPENGGRCLVNVITTVVGLKGLNKLTKLAELAKAARVTGVAQLAREFGDAAPSLASLGLREAEIRQLLTKTNEALRGSLDTLLKRIKTGDLKSLAPAMRKALTNLAALQASGRLNRDSFNSLLSRLANPSNANQSALDGTAAEIASARRVIDSGDLSPGSKVVTHAKGGTEADLGDGTKVDVGPVDQADLVYKDGRGVVHVVEVKNRAVSLVNKMRSAPNQVANLGKWSRKAAGNRSGDVMIESSDGWTDLFRPVDGGDDAMKVLAENKVPVTIAGKRYPPEELVRIHDAAASKYRKWVASGHPRDEFFKQPEMSTPEQAKNYLGIS